MNLTLVTKDYVKNATGAVKRPGPTDKFLVRRVRALKLGTETIGELLDEAKELHEAGITSLDRISEITDKLMSAGVWLVEADNEPDTIPDGIVVYTKQLIKLHKELARHEEQLANLVLTLDAKHQQE